MTIHFKRRIEINGKMREVTFEEITSVTHDIYQCKFACKGGFYVIALIRDNAGMYQIKDINDREKFIHCLPALQDAIIEYLFKYGLN
jgi:hypothetical protein